MVGFLFAGQGSQYVGMGKDLYESLPEAKFVFDKADKALGFSLSEICFSGNTEELKLTINAQPAILTATVASYAAFQKKPLPSFMAGLSLGEYSALIASGALNFEDGIRLVRRRAEIMEDACRKYPGTMAAVLELAPDKLKAVCGSTGAEIANLNAPGQTVISGKKDAVLAAKKMCEEAGAKRVIELEVSGGFHSSLMQEASELFRKVLEDIPLAEGKIPVISNYTAKPQTRPEEIRENLVLQLRSSVRWEESVRFMLAHGVGEFYEFGPGKVLKGLMRRIDPQVKVTSIEKKADIESLNL